MRQPAGLGHMRPMAKDAGKPDDPESVAAMRAAVARLSKAQARPAPADAPAAGSDAPSEPVAAPAPAPDPERLADALRRA